MDKECKRIWLVCNNGCEEIIYPDDIMDFWSNNSISTIHIKL